MNPITLASIHRVRAGAPDDGAINPSLLAARLLAEMVESAAAAAGGVTTIPARGNGTDASGSITNGGTAQNAALANPSRLYALIQNTSAGDLRFSWNATATTSVGIKLAPGQSWESPPHFCPTGVLSVWGATTGQTFTLITA